MIQKIHTQKLKTRNLTLWGHKAKLGENLSEIIIILIAQGLHTETDTAEDSLHITHQIVIDHHQTREHKAQIQEHKAQIQEHSEMHNKQYSKPALNVLDTDVQTVFKLNRIADTSRRC